MLHVNHVVVGLGKTAGHRFDHAKQTIEKVRWEKRMVNEVMRYAVDVGIDHQGINEPHTRHDPERGVREKKVHGHEIAKVEKAGERGQDVSGRVRDYLGVGG